MTASNTEPKPSRRPAGRHVWGTVRDDRLEGGHGDDVIYAGRGDDTVLLTRDAGHDIFHGESGTNTVHIYGPGIDRTSFTLTVSSGTITEFPDEILVSPEATGMIVLTDGSSLEFHQVQRITWGEER